MKVRVTNESIDTYKASSIIYVTKYFWIFGSLSGLSIPYISFYPKKRKVEICSHDGKYWGLIKK
jgi:hypothetical protein